MRSNRQFSILHTWMTECEPYQKKFAPIVFKTNQFFSSFFIILVTDSDRDRLTLTSRSEVTKFLLGIHHPPPTTTTTTTHHRFFEFLVSQPFLDWLNWNLAGWLSIWFGFATNERGSEVVRTKIEMALLDGRHFRMKKNFVKIFFIIFLFLWRKWTEIYIRLLQPCPTPPTPTHPNYIFSPSINQLD